MGIWPIRRRRADEDAERLLAAVTQISRQPAFFGEGRTQDTLEGRLEIMTLHAALALLRMKSEPGLAPLAQAFTDRLFRQFDAGLREAGVGDLAVPKRMHKIASAFYGRLTAYDAAVTDAISLAVALERNIPVPAPFARALAAYAVETAAAHKAASADALFRLDGWSSAP